MAPPLLYMMLRCQPKQRQDTLQMCNATPKGFEPLRAEPNGFLVHLLSHSDTVSCSMSFQAATRIAVLWAFICCHCVRSTHLFKSACCQSRAAPGSLYVSTGQLALACPYKQNAILIRRSEAVSGPGRGLPQHCNGASAPNGVQD